MGYQALLFCPDEKTARTVTQVLGELEFTIECCSEPFAAVKKLMGQHFDAVVVDCDNEQNATLLFKSARNSTSNQGSLAVAVVEGQAGVAKAFRIGANLVLTKPINIEQAKGTLRVARGLLRKGDPGKTAGTPAVSPAKPVAAKPVPATKAAATPTPAVASTSRPAEAKPAPPRGAPWPATAAASSAASSATQVPDALVQEAHFQEAKNQIAREQSAQDQDDDVLEIMDDSIAAPSDAAAFETAFNKLKAQDSQGSKSPAGLPPAFGRGSGAASAPAPAREVQASHGHGAEVSSKNTDAADILVDTPADAAQSESSSHTGPEPSFTFGGSNLPEKSSGASKKMFLGVAAAAIVVAVAYFGWTQFGRTSPPTSTPTPETSAPAPAPAQTAKPISPRPATPAPFTAKPTASVAPPSSLPNVEPARKQPGDDTDSASDEAASSDSSSAKPSSSNPAAAPLVVKGGMARAKSAAAAAPDAPPPSMAGMATSGAGAPSPDLVGGAASAPRPVLQTMNVSQGVSQGLLIKKVQPVYPRNALTLRIEGTVELLATLSKTGDITHIKILSGDAQLARAAAEAVKQWKYKPYLLNGEPVEIQTQVTLNFKLPN